MKTLNRCTLRYFTFLLEFKSKVATWSSDVQRICVGYERERTEIIAPVGRPVRSASDVS
jgi:hypothetical protein